MALNPRSAPLKLGATRQAAQASVEDEVEGVGSKFMKNLITYNYKTVDADLTRLQKDTTDAFPKQFHTAMRGDVQAFRKRIVDSRASSTGDVKGTTLLSSDEDTAAILVFGSQTVESSRTQGPQTRYIIVELTLLETSGGWKVDSARVPSSVSRDTLR